MAASNVIRVPFGATVAPGAQFAEFGHQVPAPDARYGYRNQFSEITFGRLVSILERADYGDTVEWAELSRRMLRTDSHLSSVYESRLVPIAGARWELEPGKGDERLAEMAKDDCERMLQQLPNLEQSFYQSLDAVGVGYSVLEIIWTVRQGMVVPEALEWLHPRRFRFDVHYKLFLYDDGRAWSYADPEQRMSVNGALGMRLSNDKYIIHLPQAVPDYAPSSGLLQTVARQWWVKQWVTKFWLQGAEVAGNPRPIGRYPQEASAEAKAELRQALESLSADGVLAMGPGVEVEFLAPLAQGNSSVWSDLIKTMNAEQSKGILGSTLNVEVGDSGGNRALGQSQFDTTTLPRAERDGRAMWSSWEAHLFRSFLKLNIDRYGGKMPPVPHGRFVLYEAPVEVDELLVSIGGASVDDVRESRGLERRGPEKGGDAIAVMAGDPAVMASPVSDSPDAPPPPPAALNGAQIGSLLEIVQKVASNQIPRDTGLNLIVSAFPLTLEQADRIMGQVGNGFVPTPEGQPPQPPMDPYADPYAAPPADPYAQPAPFEDRGPVTGRPFRESPWTTAMKMSFAAASPTSTPSARAAKTPKRPSARRRR